MDLRRIYISQSIKSNSCVQTELLWTLWNTSCSLNSLWKSYGKEPWFAMNVFFFLLQLSNGTEETQYTSILILLVYKQNIFLSPWSVLTLLLSPVHNFFVYSFILTKFWRPTTQDSNWAEVLFERSVLDIRFIRLKKPHLFRIVAS